MVILHTIRNNRIQLKKEERLNLIGVRQTLSTDRGTQTNTLKTWLP